MKQIFAIFLMLLVSGMCLPVLAWGDDDDEDEVDDDDEDEDEEDEDEEDEDEEDEDDEDEEEDEDEDEDDEDTSVPINMHLGGFFGMGMATMIAEGYEVFSFEHANLRAEQRTLAFSYGGGAYFDYFFTDLLGVHVGLDFVTKGTRFRVPPGSQWDRERIRLCYLEIPIALKLDVKNLLIGLGLAFNVAISGKTRLKSDSEVEKSKWLANREWLAYRRVNLAPWIHLGYAIETGPVEVVPSITWSIHLINDINRDAEVFDGAPNDTFRMRAMNLMFNVGVQYGF